MANQYENSELPKSELMQKILRLINYAEQQDEFVIVYRGEGEMDDHSNRSPNGTHFIGTWYTESFQKAEDFKKLAGKSSQNTRILALLIPTSLLDSREVLDKGLQQINIMNPDLRESAVEVTSQQSAKLKIRLTKEFYLMQFKYYRDYIANNN
jgi:hypothetical protein